VHRLFQRAIKKGKSEGLLPLLKSTSGYSLRWGRDCTLRFKYLWEYGDLAPSKGERGEVNPRHIDHYISSKHIPDNAPSYGILDGSWDLYKTPWRESSLDGLRERFAEGKPWEETTYYERNMEIISQGERSPLADKTSNGKSTSRAETREEFEEYLSHLDDVYESIKDEGYNNSSVITVSIGREGRWMTNHGNHRRTMAAILGVESVPVQIKYRHREWQEKRIQIYNVDDPTNLSDDLKQYLDHPDIIF